MSTVDVDMTLYFHRKHTPPPSVLLLTGPNDNSRDYEGSPTTEHRPNQPKKRPPPHMIGLHVSNLDVHDTSTASFGWQRHSDKNNQLNLAPDVAYRNTYLEEMKKKEKKDPNNEHNHCCSLSPHNQKSSQSQFKDSSSSCSLKSSQQKNSSHQYSTIYDYIRASIRDIERHRNKKQQNISSRVKRPQNDDCTLRRILGEKKSPVRTSMSRNSSTTTTTTTTTTQTISSLFNNDLKSPQSFVNYINYSRTLHSSTSNQSYQQQRSILSQN
ncbi:unnamed protein product [Rotaria sordida]|uniref:Uncharacterized protein n=1 Tax=Rotaria sordida TaxID=392033 RepID=A0A814LI94_9BILA|nr:unnamed protein product [Rotaria sordida]CAF3695526.1 unnamed protein product [Rotaria sordida]